MVTVCTTRFNPIYISHTLLTQYICVFSTDLSQMPIILLYSLTYSFLQLGENVFTVRYELNL